MKHHIDLPMQDAREALKAAHSGKKPDKAIIYIAGPITGLKNGNKAAFKEAAEQLHKRGYAVLNPRTLPEGMPEDLYMPICLAMLQAADIICMLPGWSNSRGANIELEFVKYQGKDVQLLDNLLQKEGEAYDPAYD